MLSVLTEGEKTALSEVLARMTPDGARLRYDRRVDAMRRITRHYPDWQSLLFGEGLSWRQAGDELHIFPAGLAAGEIELNDSQALDGQWQVKAGDSLRSVLERWGARAGVQVIFLTDQHLRLDTHAAFDGTFMEATRALLFQLAHLPRPPVAEATPDGRTLSILHLSPKGDVR